MARSRRTVNNFFRLRKYSLMLCMMYELMIFCQVSNIVFMVFAGAAVTVSGCDEDLFNNLSYRDRCEKYNRLKGSANCTPTFTEGFYSIGREFGYVCESAKYVKWSTSIQMAAFILGSIIFWYFAEAFGPWKGLAFVTLALSIVSLASSFTDGLNSFTAARFFVMLFVGGQNRIAVAFVIENLPKRHRVWLVTVMSFTPSYLLMDGIAFATKHWRWLSRVIAAIAIAPFFFLCFIYESPGWLLRKGKFAKAKKAILGIGEWDCSNKAKKIYELNELLNDEKEKQDKGESRLRKQYGLRSLFSRPRTAWYTVFFSLSLMTTSVINYGILFNLEYFSCSHYISFLYIGFLRCFAKGVFASVDFFSRKVGRRHLHIITMALIVAVLITAALLTLFANQERKLLTLAVLTASALCSEIYFVNAYSSAELLAASIRPIGNTVIQLFNKIGAVAAPHVFHLSTVWTAFPYLLMSVLGLVDLITFFLLIPETKGMFYDKRRRKDRDGGSVERGIDKRTTTDTTEDALQKLAKLKDEIEKESAEETGTPEKAAAESASPKEMAQSLAEQSDQVNGGSKTPTEKQEGSSLAKPPIEKQEGSSLAKPPIEKQEGSSLAKPPTEQQEGSSKTPSETQEGSSLAKTPTEQQEGSSKTPSETQEGSSLAKTPTEKQEGSSLAKTPTE